MLRIVKEVKARQVNPGIEFFIGLFDDMRGRSLIAVVFFFLVARAACGPRGSIGVMSMGHVFTHDGECVASTTAVWVPRLCTPGT